LSLNRLKISLALKTIKPKPPCLSRRTW